MGCNGRALTFKNFTMVKTQGGSAGHPFFWLTTLSSIRRRLQGKSVPSRLSRGCHLLQYHTALCLDVQNFDPCFSTKLSIAH